LLTTVLDGLESAADLVFELGKHLVGVLVGAGLLLVDLNVCLPNESVGFNLRLPVNFRVRHGTHALAVGCAPDVVGLTLSVLQELVTLGEHLLRLPKLRREFLPDVVDEVDQPIFVDDDAGRQPDLGAVEDEIV
jgi:hypothetical protein